MKGLHNYFVQFSISTLLSIQASLTGTLTFLVVPCNEFPVAENEVDDSSVSTYRSVFRCFFFFLFMHGRVGYNVGVNRFLFFVKTVYAIMLV